MHYEDAKPAYHAIPVGLPCTPKAPPSFEGEPDALRMRKRSTTGSTPQRCPQQPGHRVCRRLTGISVVFKPMIENLRDLDNGVAFFKADLRPHYLSGSESVYGLRLCLNDSGYNAAHNTSWMAWKTLSSQEKASWRVDRRL